MTTPPTISLVWTEVLRSLRVLHDRTVQLGTVLAAGMLLLSLGTVPNGTPGIGSWIFLILIGIVLVLAQTCSLASRDPNADDTERQFRRTAALTLSVTALVFNAMLSISSTIVLGILMLLVVRETAHVREGMFPWRIGALLITLIPWWIWTAVGHWNAGLLVLLPLVGLAWLAETHLRAGMRESDDPGPSLSNRGHRFAAWMSMLAGGLLVVLIGMLMHDQRSWLGLGGIAMIFAVAGEAGAPSSGTSPGKFSALISNVAFIFLVACWLTAIR